jgi:hypothetical protein
VADGRQQDPTRVQLEPRSTQGIYSHADINQDRNVVLHGHTHTSGDDTHKLVQCTCIIY